jgi:hypothetical protein
MLASFHIFELMTEEASNRGGEWLFQYDELERAGELQKEFKAKTTTEAVEKLKPFLDQYFTERNLEPLIEITLSPPKAKIVSTEAARFILASKALRGNSKRGKEFEDLVADQLCQKLRGQVMSVGYRQQGGISAFRNELKSLGVDLAGVKYVKDGGLDVIWLPPLGKKSEIPFASFQCKNTETIGDDIKSSISDARKTLKRHHLFMPNDFPLFVVINTYLDQKAIRDSDGRGCTYLGLPELLPCRPVPDSPVFI